MTIRTKHIQSCPDPDCPMPWVEFSSFQVTRDGIEFRIAKINGIAARPDVRGDRAKEARLVGVHKFPFGPAEFVVGDDMKREPHTLAITMEGDLIFCALSKQPLVLYAHLAFVDTDTLDADVLAFDPEPPDPLRVMSAHIAHVERELAAVRAAQAKATADADTAARGTCDHV